MVALLGMCFMIAACQNTHEEPPSKMLPVEMVAASGMITQDGKDKVIRFDSTGTFLLVAHTGTEASPGTWYSGLYRAPGPTEIPTLRPVLSVDFDTDVATDGAINAVRGLYLPSSVAGTKYHLHLIHPAVNDLKAGLMAVSRTRSTYFSSAIDSMTIISTNSYFVTTLPKTIKLTEINSALTIRVQQRDENATAVINSIELLNPGDIFGSTHLHKIKVNDTVSTWRTTLSYTPGINNPLAIDSDKKYGWRKTGNTGAGEIVYVTDSLIRIHCANYKTTPQTLAISLSVTYTIVGRDEPVLASVTIPLSFLDALPSMQYNLTLVTTPKAVYVTYNVNPYGKKVTQEGELGGNSYIGGTFLLSTGMWEEGVWKQEYNFDNDI